MFRPDGNILIDGMEVAETRQCPHCNGHFVSIRGSGVKRGYCMLCGKVTCGKQKCDSCTPFEKKLEQYEKGKRLILD